MTKITVMACLLLVAQQYSLAQAPNVMEPKPAFSKKVDPAWLKHGSLSPQQSTVVPMDQRERFHQYLEDLSRPSFVIGVAATAGLGQWENSPKEWMQGSEGYSKRLGDAFAQHIMMETMMFGAASTLHEDNRYFPSGKSGFGGRLKYAIASTFLARKDDGNWRLSYSRIGATAGTAFLSRVWQPRSTGTAGDGATSFGISEGTQVGLSVAREFLPRLFHHITGAE